MDTKAKERIIRPIKSAINNNDPIEIGNALKQAARQMHLLRETKIAIQFSEFALNFLENSNIFTLVLVDWHYYKTGERVNPESIHFQIPEIKPEIPLAKLKEYIENLQ